MKKKTLKQMKQDGSLEAGNKAREQKPAEEKEVGYDYYTLNKRVLENKAEVLFPFILLVVFLLSISITIQ